MTPYTIAIVDPEVGDSGTPIYHFHIPFFHPEQTIYDVLIYFCLEVFSHVIAGTSGQSLIERGLKFARFSVIEVQGHQQRKLDVRQLDLAWETFCSSFNPLIDITFYLQSKSVVPRVAAVSTGAIFNVLRTPAERKMAERSQEIDQQGIYLPLTYLEFISLSTAKNIVQPYVEIQWNNTVKILFEENDIRYKNDVVQNHNHDIYRFISVFCLLLNKLNYRWSKMIKLDGTFQSCFLHGKFFEDSKRIYSSNDAENDLSH